MKDLKTNRLQIVPLTAEQLDLLLKQPQEDEHMAAALSEMYRGCAENPKDWFWYTCWQIYLRSDETRIGSLCFKGSPMNGAVEIGYGIDEKHRNQGYAAEAVRAIADWAFTNPDVYFVLAETANDNFASIRVLEKTGFTDFGEGPEGPRRIKERPQASLVSAFLCIGMSVGLAIGTATGKAAIGIGLGALLGAAVGAAFDARDNAIRKKYKRLI